MVKFIYIYIYICHINKIHKKYTYPIIIFDVDISFHLNKGFQCFYTAFSSCNVQGSPLTEKNKDIKIVEIDRLQDRLAQLGGSIKSRLSVPNCPIALGKKIEGKKTLKDFA